MKDGIHPALHKVKVTCVCGNEFDSESTVKGEAIKVEICNKCHPFYSGKTKVVDVSGRIDKFNNKLNKNKK